MTTPLKKLDVGEKDVLTHMRITGLFREPLRDVLERELCAQAARKHGLSISDQELQEAANSFRHLMGLESAEDTSGWLHFHNMNLEELESYLETSLLMKKWKEQLTDDIQWDKHLDHKRVRETIREVIYDNWLETQV